MPDFRKTYTYTTDGGDTVEVRRLSVVARAQRDVEIAEHQLAYEDLFAEYRENPATVLEGLIAERGRLSADQANDSPENAERRDLIAVEIAGITPQVTVEAKREKRRIESKIAEILNLHIKPHVIRKGLVAINGDTGAVEDLLSTGDEKLIDEIYVFCDLAARLSADQLKNLQPPGTSGDPAAQTNASSNAASVEKPATTSNETAVATSPVK
jgi:hypothetical protein